MRGHRPQLHERWLPHPTTPPSPRTITPLPPRTLGARIHGCCASALILLARKRMSLLSHGRFGSVLTFMKNNQVHGPCWPTRNHMIQWHYAWERELGSDSTRTFTLSNRRDRDSIPQGERPQCERHATMSCPHNSGYVNIHTVRCQISRLPPMSCLTGV